MANTRSTGHARGGTVRFGAVVLGPWRRRLALAMAAVAALAGWNAGPDAVLSVDAPAVYGLDLRKPVYSVPAGDRVVGLAVNVDWGEEYLPAMLAALEERGARATFFLTGRWAAAHPELVRRMAADGHELGNHGYRHDHPKSLSDQELAALIERNRELLEDIARVRTVLFAPPYGEVDPRIARVAAETGHWTIMWTVDTVDWRRPPPETIVRRVVSRVQPGAIVLMHPTAPTLEALPVILDQLLADGWRVVSVGQLLQAAGATSLGARGPASTPVPARGPASAPAVSFVPVPGA